MQWEGGEWKKNTLRNERLRPSRQIWDENDTVEIDWREERNLLRFTFFSLSLGTVSHHLSLLEGGGRGNQLDAKTSWSGML